MKLSIPITETIQKRHSVRTYEERELSAQDRSALADCMNHLDNPFGVHVNKYIIDKKLSANGEKLGTYGVIKGAGTFLGISIPDTRLAPLAAGYEFENLILYATHLGLGTVWLAATFDRKSFSAAMEIPQDELFPAISPVGYPAPKRSMTETIMRTSMKSSARKPWEELFFQEDFETPLAVHMAGLYAQSLEMVRLAPSAKNAQPWRICKDGDYYHFYVTYKQGLSKGEELIKYVDLGIALSHFHQSVLEQELTGSFEFISRKAVKIPENTYYILSWHIDESK